MTLTKLYQYENKAVIYFEIQTCNTEKVEVRKSELRDIRSEFKKVRIVRCTQICEFIAFNCENTCNISLNELLTSFFSAVHGSIAPILLL